MQNEIKVIIVDDHQIIRDGLLNMLSTTDDIKCIATASDGQEAINKVKCLKPDIVITDISMTGMNGIELTNQLILLNPAIKVLVLTMYTNEDYIFSVIRAGAKGVLPKQDTNSQILIDAIRCIYAGKEYFGNEISKILMKSIVHHGKKNDPAEIMSIYKLTTREKEILTLFADGLSNNEIAKKLSISIRTVETHKNNIMQKYNFKSTVEMVKFAIRNNIVSI